MFGLPEALMSFFRRQVGLRTDAASETGSLHAKIAKNYAEIKLLGKMATPSNNVRDSTVNEVSVYNNTTFTKVKEIMVNVTGLIRTSMEIYTTTTYNGSARIYINDSPVGTERATDGATHLIFTEDLSVRAGDRIQVYLKSNTTSPSRCILANFSVCWDLVEAVSMVTMDLSGSQ